MNRYRVFRSGLICIMLFAAACASTDNEQQLKRADATRNLGEAYLREGKYTLALKELLKAESLNPNDPYMQNDIGLVYYAKGRYDTAIRHYKNALDLKHDYPPAMNNLGNAYAAQKRWESAIEYYNKALDSALYATPHFPLSNLGNLYYEKKDYERSEEYYLKALKIQPDFSSALLGIGRTYVAMGRLKDAIGKLEKAVRINPDKPVLFYELANVYRLAGNYRDARLAYAQVIHLVPESKLSDLSRRALQELN